LQQQQQQQHPPTNRMSVDNVVMSESDSSSQQQQQQHQNEKSGDNDDSMNNTNAQGDGTNEAGDDGEYLCIYIFIFTVTRQESVTVIPRLIYNTFCSYAHF
jgi:hypothetical protein